jgi:hypothetical protein
MGMNTISPTGSGRNSGSTVKKRNAGSERKKERSTREGTVMTGIRAAFGEEKISKEIL